MLGRNQRVPKQGNESAYYKTLNKNETYPPWITAFPPTPNLMSNQRQVETILLLRKIRPKKDILSTVRGSTVKPK